MCNQTLTMTQARDHFHADKLHAGEIDILQHSWGTVTAFYTDAQVIIWTQSEPGWSREVYQEDRLLGRQVYA